MPRGNTRARLGARLLSLTAAAGAAVAAVPLSPASPLVVQASGSAPVSISTVTGTVYPNPANSGTFDATQLGNALFSEQFPSVAFNPPSAAQVYCSNSTGVTESTRPFTAVNQNPDGTCSTQVVQGNGLQAGSGSLVSFQGSFVANLTVASAGQVTFNFFSDDGWILGIGPQSGGSAQPTYVSGALTGAPSTSPLKGYRIVGAYNQPSAPTQTQVTVSFPFAGTYPMELDYTECCGGQESLTLGTTFATPIPSTVSESESYGSSNPSEIAPHACAGDPVNCATGNFFETSADLAVAGRGPGLDWERSYNSLAASATGALGYGWSFSYGMHLAVNPSDGSATITQENGSTVTFAASGGSYVAPSWVLASLVHNADGTWTFTRRQRTVITFASGGALQSIADLNGYTTSLAYDANGHLTTVTDSASRTLTVAWGANGLISGVTDPAGRVAGYGYDASDNLTTVTDAAGAVTHFGYDASHLLQTVTDPRGGVLTNTYNGAAQVTRQSDPMNRVTQLAYGNGTTTITDPLGNVTQETFSNQHLLLSRTRAAGTAFAATWAYTYDPTTLGVASVTDPNNHLTRQTYDARGNRTAVTDGLNRTTRFAYDTLDDLTQVTDMLGTSVTTLVYDTHGNLQTVSTPIPDAGLTQLTRYTYDASHPGDLVSVTDPDTAVTHYAYDSSTGDRVAVTDPDGNVTTYAYNAIGWVTAKVSPRGNLPGAVAADFTTSYAYDGMGRPLSVTDPLQHVVSFTYDGDGNRLSLTLPDNTQTLYSYNADNQVTAVQRPDGSVLGTGYDGAGNMSTQTDPLGKVTSYTYDPLNRLASVTDPLLHHALYFYDLAGNHTATQDQLGGTASYGHDAADELTSISYSDTGTPGVSFSYDADGRRQTMSVGSQGWTWVRDSIGRITSLIDGQGRVISYTYDVANRLKSITYPGAVGVTVNGQPFLSGTVQRAYTPAGRLQTVTDWKSNVSTFGYDADGNLASIAYGNGTSASLGYDNADRLTGITDTAPNLGRFLDLPYARDAAGRVLTQNATGTPAPQTIDTMAYDANGRLTGSDVSPTVPGIPTQTWSYNGADQMVAQSTSAASRTLAYDDAAELTGITGSAGSTAITYNARGDRVKQLAPGNVTTTYGWDGAGMLRSWTGPAVNAAGSLAGQTLAQEGWSYDGDGLRTDLAWDRLSGSVPLVLQDLAANYVYGPGDMPLEQITAAGTVSYYHLDQLGSVRALTDSNANVVGSYTYDPYGRQLTASSQVANPLGFAGQYTDAVSGLIYMRARWYDPSTGQFLSRDPLSALTRAPYTYVGDDPVNNSDPTGLDSNCDVVPRPWDLEQSCLALGAASVLSNGVETAGNAIATPVYAPADAQDLACLEEQAQQDATGWALPWLDRAGTVLAVANLIDGEGEAYFAAKALSEGAEANLTVQQFIGSYLKGSVNREMPGEYLNMTVKDALASGNSKVRKLLTDQRFRK